MFYDNEWTFLTEEEFLKIKTSFELKNLKKIQEMKMWFWGWDKLPDKINHHRIWKDWLIKVPAGIRSVWQDRFEDKYWAITQIDIPDLINPYWEDEDMELTNKQISAVKTLLWTNVWLLHADTATWKTRIAAMIIDKLKCRTLVVCCNIILMNQMKKDLFKFFWKKYKTLCWTKTKQKDSSDDIVIINIDTAVKQSFEFLQQFDLVIFDEADTYFSSENRLWLLFDCPMKYQYWLTWTIILNHIDNKILNIYLWLKTELMRKNFHPDFYRVVTDFEYKLEDLKKLHILRKELYYDEDRNKLIVDIIEKTIWNRKWIVFTEFIEATENICKMIEERWIKTFMIIWRIKTEERDQIKKDIKAYKWRCCLVGNTRIIWRGYDLPELSVWYLTVCEKFTSNISQYAWRIIRKFKGKTGCDFYDFMDTWCAFLANQAKSRKATYKRAFYKSKIKFY